MGKRTDRNPSGYHSYGRTHKEKVWNFAMFIKEFGWTGDWWEDEETEMIHLKATRGDLERIEVEYPVNQPWPDVFYTLAGNTIKCRNISMAARIAQNKPDVGKMRRSSRRALSRGTAASLLRSPEPGRNGPLAPQEVAAGTGSLPFDRESTADEVKQALVKFKNPVITWVNHLAAATRTRRQGPDSTINTAVVKTKSRHFKVFENKEGKVIIQFITEEGFRSVYKDSIIGVS